MATQTLRLTRANNLRPIVNIFALGMTITINALANILPINGIQTGAISDLYPSLFTPAGYVFSIWGLIYTLLIVFVVFQALPSQRNNPRLQNLGYIFALSCVANSLWIFSWHYQAMVWSQVLIVALLVLLLIAYRRLDIEKVNKGLTVSRAEKWTTHVAFSIYTGWLTVATVANTCIMLLHLGVTGNAVFWGVLVILAALVIGGAFSFINRDAAYGLVLVWAFIGIGVKHQDIQAVMLTAFVSAGFMALIVGRNFFAKLPKTPVAYK